MNKVITFIIIGVIALVGIIYVLNKNYSPQQAQLAPTKSQEVQTNPASSSTQQTNSDNSVTIQNFSFTPTQITIKAGESVTWTNQDSVSHSATSDDGSFDTGLISQGQSKSITFAKAGTFSYHCGVHPNMKATITVQ